MFEEPKLIPNAKATLVSVVHEKFEGHQSEAETQYSLKELRELLRTLGVEAQSEKVQYLRKITPATILGQGKLEQFAEEAKAEGSNYLVFDFELTAVQLRNINELTGLEVMDRNYVILEIFAKHAHTAEAKIQIEIARLEYFLPRLRTLWSHFSRQRGGIGVRGGEGEQQIELDRRIIREKIEHFRKQLGDLRKTREEQGKKRQKNVVTAALVGYTNAGKSSLMNRLCKVKVLEEDKLFATLDSTYRTLNPDSKPPMVLIDTVGFISNLPATLVSGFRTTLESVLEANLLIIVCDLSDPNRDKHLEVTYQILKELNVEDKDKMIVFTKKDKIDSPFVAKIVQRGHPNSHVVSTYDERDMQELRSTIINYFLSKQDHYDLYVPYEDGNAHSRLLARANILSNVNHETGIFYRIRVPDFIFQSLGVNQYILAPNDPRVHEFSSPKSSP